MTISEFYHSYPSVRVYHEGVELDEGVDFTMDCRAGKITLVNAKGNSTYSVIVSAATGTELINRKHRRSLKIDNSTKNQPWYMRHKKKR